MRFRFSRLLSPVFVQLRRCQLHARPLCTKSFVAGTASLAGALYLDYTKIGVLPRAGTLCSTALLRSIDDTTVGSSTLVHSLALRCSQFVLFCAGSIGGRSALLAGDGERLELLLERARHALLAHNDSIAEALLAVVERLSAEPAAHQSLLAQHSLVARLHELVLAERATDSASTGVARLAAESLQHLSAGAPPTRQRLYEARVFELCQLLAEFCDSATSFQPRLSVCATLANLASDDALYARMLDDGALPLLLRLASNTQPRQVHQRLTAVDGSATELLPAGVSIPLHEAGEQVAGVASQREVARALVAFAHHAESRALLATPAWLHLLKQWAESRDKQLRLLTANALSALTHDEPMALLVLQTIGADVFVHLSEIVDVDVQAVVERCLQRMQQPDAKLARVDVETREFVIDSQFRVRHVERVKQ